MARSRSKSTSADILSCLGTCCVELAANQEEQQAKKDHEKGDHRTAALHYQRAASFHQRSGNAYAAINDQVNANEEASHSGPSCIIL